MICSRQDWSKPHVSVSLLLQSTLLSSRYSLVKIRSPLTVLILSYLEWPRREISLHRRRWSDAQKLCFQVRKWFPAERQRQTHQKTKQNRSISFFAVLLQYVCCHVYQHLCGGRGGGAQVSADGLRMMELSCYEMWHSSSIIEDHHHSVYNDTSSVWHQRPEEIKQEHQHQLFFPPEPPSQQPYCRLEKVMGRICASWETDASSSTSSLPLCKQGRSSRDALKADI